MPESEGGSDLLYGVGAIAAHLNLTKRQVYHLASTGGLPTFKIGKTVCGRKTAVEQWLKTRSEAAPK